MFRFASLTRLASSSFQRVSLLAIAGMLVAIGVPRAAPLIPNDKIVRSSEKPDLEVLLIGVCKELAANNLRKAQ